MTNFRMALLDLLRKDERRSDPAFLRDGLRLLALELMDASNGDDWAAPYERTDKRVTSRNGFREREWDTRVRTLELAIPNLRQSSSFRRCSNRGASTSGLCWRWCRKPRPRGRHPQRRRPGPGTGVE
jgi:hypothetical protein